MRFGRLFLLCFLLTAAVGCFDVETTVQVFQDGSGTYREQIDIPQKSMELLIGQMAMETLDDLVAELVDKELDRLEQCDGVRLLDASGVWTSNEFGRITLMFGFDSVEQWNKYSSQSNSNTLSFSSTQINGATTPPQMEWTLGIEFAGRTQPTLPTGSMSGVESAAPQAQPEMTGGSYNLVLVGPVDAPADNYMLDAGASEENLRLPDGSVAFSGPPGMIVKPATYRARFVGPMLTAEELAARKKLAFQANSDNLKKIMQIIEQRREAERIRQAADEAITQTHFDIKIKILDDEAMITSSRTYFGVLAAYFAEREMLLHNLAPEIGGNYQVSITPVKTADGREGVQVTRARRQSLPLEALAPLLASRRDGQDTVYTFSPQNLLAPGALAEMSQHELGRVELETPARITGTNGKVIDPHRVEMRFGLQHAREGVSLIVRTTPGGGR